MSFAASAQEQFNAINHAWAEGSTTDRVQICLVVFVRMMMGVAIATLLFQILAAFLWAWLAFVLALIGSELIEPRITKVVATPLASSTGVAAAAIVSGFSVVRSWF